MGFKFELIGNVTNSFLNTVTCGLICCCCKQMIVIITIVFLVLIRFAVKCFWVKNCLPVLTFRHVPKSGNKQEESPYCTVCLDEVSNGEKYRQLPECKHCFHVDCIDAWFQSRSTCPLCRNQVSAAVPHLRRGQNQPHQHQHGLLISSLLGILQNIVSIMDKVPPNSENNTTFVIGTETETETSSSRS